MLFFNNSDIVFLAAICVGNVICASVVHRAVLLNSGFMQRRLLFEGLSLFGFLVAIALSLFSVLIWVRNPAFVIACTTVWVTLCTLTVLVIWRDHRKRFNRKALEIPEFWDQHANRSDQPGIGSGRNTDGSEAILPGLATQTGNSPGRTLHGTADAAEVFSASHPSQTALMANNDVRDKLENYNKKRACKSASISNLAAYRHRSKKDIPQSSDKMACK